MNTREFKLSGFFLAVSVLLFVYVVLRACNLSFTHDEALSYNLVSDKNYFGYTANNHLLNTLLMALFSGVFGESELVLRLPNVLLFAVYLFFCFKLINSGKKNLFTLFAIPLLLFNPFMLDFFALARGYGLSLGFMMGSLYYFLGKDLRQSSEAVFFKHFALSLLFAALALLSNLALINFYIALLLLFVGQYILLFAKPKEGVKKRRIHFFLLCLLGTGPLLFSLNTLLVLSNANGLYTGAGTFDESISSFIERSSYFIPYPVWFAELLQTFIEIIVPIGFIITLLRRNFYGALFKLSLLLLIVIAGIYLEHYLFGALFPISRTGIYFIPLFGLFLYYLFIQLLENSAGKWQNQLLISGTVLVALPLTIHFLVTSNLSHTFEWKYDTHTKEVVLHVNAENKQTSLGHNWIFGPAINYYIKSRGLSVKPVKLEEGSVYEQDFIYEFQDQLKDINWKPLELYKDIGSGLYKNPKGLH